MPTVRGSHLCSPVNDHSELERRLGAAFVRRDLLRLALVHGSYRNENPGSFQESNERLEFLGDAVIGAIVAEELFRRNPAWSEGELTHARSVLVKDETLAGLARRFDLGRRMYMGRGEESGGGRDRPSILAAAFEAVVGALFIDQGYQAARSFVVGLVLPELAAAGLPKNPKAAFQEAVQAQGSAAPSYETVQSGGKAHAPIFTAEVSVEGEVMGRGSGPRKAAAERAAAAQALESIQRKLARKS